MAKHLHPPLYGEVLARYRDALNDGKVNLAMVLEEQHPSHKEHMDKIFQAVTKRKKFEKQFNKGRTP